MVAAEREREKKTFINSDNENHYLQHTRSFSVLHFASTDSAAALFFWRGRQKWLHMEACHLSRWWREGCPTGVSSLELQTSAPERRSYKIKPQDKGKHHKEPDGVADRGRSVSEPRPTRSQVLAVLLCSVPAQVPRWAHFIWRQTVHLQEEGADLRTGLQWLKCGYFQLEASWMLTRQWGVWACLMRQNSSYL